MRSGQLQERSALQIRDVHIREQLAYQLLQFLRRYPADVEHLKTLLPDRDTLMRYLNAMQDGDGEDAKRLTAAIEEALERRE